MPKQRTLVALSMATIGVVGGIGLTWPVTSHFFDQNRQERCRTVARDVIEQRYHETITVAEGQARVDDACYGVPAVDRKAIIDTVTDIVIDEHYDEIVENYDPTTDPTPLRSGST